MSENQLAAGGLKTVYNAQILTILTIVVGLIVLAAGGGMLGFASFALLTGVLMLGLMAIAFIMNLVGLHKAGKAHRDFKTAFIATIAAIVISLAANLFKEGAAAYLADLAKLLLDFAVVFFVCRGAAVMLAVAGHGGIARLGSLTRGLYLASALIAELCDIAGATFLVTFATPILVVSTVVSMAGGILYLIFLGKAAKALAGAPDESAETPL